MTNIIQTKRVVVTKSGLEFDSPSAIKRHEYQTSIGQGRTRLSIAKVVPVQEQEEPDETNE